jgi:hypothetical protein
MLQSAGSAFNKQSPLNSQGDHYTGIVHADFDGDGDVDFAATSSWPTGLAVFRNDGTDLNGATSWTSVLPDHHDRVQCAAWADVDDDGDLDLFAYETARALGNPVPPPYTYGGLLYRNDAGSFTRVLNASIAEDYGTLGYQVTLGAHAASFGDYNGDGRVDLLVAGPQTRLYRNDNANASVLDWARISSGTLVQTTNTMGVYFADLDSDGDLDVLLLTRYSSDRVFENTDGLGGFVERHIAAFQSESGTSEAAALADFDGDGNDDLFVARGSGSSALYRNEGSWAFTLRTDLDDARSGYAYDATFGDVDGGSLWRSQCTHSR